MMRRSTWLSSVVLALSLGWSGSATAQAQDADAAAAPPLSDPPVQAAPPAQPQAYPYAQPRAYPYGYPAQPYPYVVRDPNSPEARQATVLAAMEERQIEAARGAPAFLWRIAVEAGGTGFFGRVDHYADGKRLPIDRYHSHSDTDGAFDFRLTVQRAFGNRFALGGQFGWTNWQSDHLDETLRLRSDYVSLAVQPELRLPLGRCRRCPALLVAGRVGVALAVRGKHEYEGAGREQSDLGVGAVWGARAGIEVPLGSRARLRFSTGYEGAWLQHRVAYRALGSEVLAFLIQRPMTTLGVSVGL